MRRRDFIVGLASPATWPLAARAQQAERVRRVGVVMGVDENDTEGKLRYSALTQAPADLGWTDSRNLRIDLRWGGAGRNRRRALAQELVGLQPDIIMTNGSVRYLTDRGRISRQNWKRLGWTRTGRRQTKSEI
jgi:putative tryptophan/tyrosine transport system substrate-binding protein